MIAAVSDAAVEEVVAELVQGSAAWLAMRCGKFTGSIVHPLVATRGTGAGRTTLIRTVAAERLSGIPQGFEGNEDTDFGHEQEPHARRAFCIKHGVFITPVGFKAHPLMPYAGCSPDGLVPDEYGVEFKSHRKAKKFLEMIESAIPRAHHIQCQMGLACYPGLPRWAFNNYCPEMPEGQRLHTRWVERDDALIAELTVEIKRAEKEVVAKVAEILSRKE